MPTREEIDRQIRSTVYRYCETFDSGDFAAFAALFEHGRWFMVSESGAGPVRTWIEENVLLYDGRPLTRHEIHNPMVESSGDVDEATFRCYVAIWQHLPEQPARLLTHARFAGSFRRRGSQWWWMEHQATVDYAGDLSGHIRGLSSTRR